MNIKKWLTYIVFVASVVAVGSIYGFAQKKNKTVKINKIDIDFVNNKMNFLNDEMVNKLLIQTEGNPLNQLNSTLNLHLIEKSLFTNEAVQNVEAYLNPKGHLHIKIEQKVPIVRISERAEEYYLDQEGKRMPLSQVYTVRVPLAKGIYNTIIEKELFHLVDAFRKDEFFSKQIIGINRLSNGDYHLYPRIGEYVINFGDTTQTAGKMKKMKVFYKKMWNDSLLKKYKEISIKYKKQVICTY